MTNRSAYAIQCLVGIGSNLGQRAETLDLAIEMLAGRDSIRLLARSRWHETLPVGGPSGQGAFLNGALRLETPLSPDGLLARLQHIESRLGRTRQRRWGPRTVDLDLLLYGCRTIQTPRLQVPHPRMAFRRFVMEPAAEIAADMLHAPTGWTVGRLADHLRLAPAYVAIAGPCGAGKARLAADLSRAFSGRLMVDPIDARRLARFAALPAGEALELELELLDKRSRMLSRAAYRDDGLVVSDFWWGQSPAIGSHWLSGRRLARFLEACRQAMATIVRPKLLIVLDTPEIRSLAGSARSAARNEESQTCAAIRSAIMVRARQPGLGPALWLDARDPEYALSESRAAIEAMG